MTKYQPNLKVLHFFPLTDFQLYTRYKDEDSIDTGRERNLRVVPPIIARLVTSSKVECERANFLALKS